MDNKILNTSMGEIKGLEFDDYLEFRGIRYANAARWEYPEPVDSWEGVYDATKYGACCFQERAYTVDAETNPFYWKEFREHRSFTYSEDCHFLNIVAPKNADKCPVFVYIYGGSFTGGSSDEEHFNGVPLAKEGVMWVAMNYRINCFGFPNHPELTDEQGRCGNFGLYDQVCALEWIKRHIAEFGGDPDNITLAGESAGAMSVDLIMSTDRVKALGLKGAVMMSGAGIQRVVAKPKSPEKGKAYWEEVMQNAGVSSMAELKKIPDEELYNAWKKAYDNQKLGMTQVLPSCDGVLITKDNFKMSTIPTEYPQIYSVTMNDMFCIALLKVNQMMTKRAMKNGNKAYMANFARPLPGDDIGAWHASDLLYVFNTLDTNWRPFEEIDYKIADQMTKSLIAFCKTHDPNCAEIPTWTTGYKSAMRFCENTQMMPWDKKQMLDNTIHHEGPI